MAGPELILAGLAFPAAVFSTTQLLIDYGRSLKEKGQQYKNADKTVAKFKILGTSLYEGNLSMSINEAVAACADPSTPSSSKEGLNGYVDELAEALRKSEVLLHKVVKEDGSIRGVGYVLKSREKDLQKSLEELGRVQGQIESQLQILKRHQKRTISDNLLDHQNFKEINIGLLPDTNLRLGQAKIKSGDGFKTVSVIYERRESRGVEAAILKADTSALARALSDQQPGILKCLGYRLSPLDLVFEVPASTQAPKTLWRLLSEEKAPGNAITLATYAGGHSLQARFHLSLQLSAAVLSVHSKNFVHKNIRSSSILLFKPEGSANTEIGEPYLSDWEIVHKTRDMSISDPDSRWQEDIYRHPERQNFLTNLPEPNLGHDIYSLGVCLLEIGLWEPLIVEKASAQNPQQTELVLSDTVSQAALQHGFIDATEVGASDRTLEPDQVRIILKELAEQYLPSRMGSIYTGLVVSCLNCLNPTEPSAFGDAAALVDADSTATIFNKLIKDPLGKLRV